MYTHIRALSVFSIDPIPVNSPILAPFLPGRGWIVGLYIDGYVHNATASSSLRTGAKKQTHDVYIPYIFNSVP